MPASRPINILRPAAVLFAILLALTGASSALAAGQQENLYSGIKDFEALTQDPQRGLRRDLWEALEKRFARIEAQGKDYAAEAYFYQARSREELAYRSKRKSDYQGAAQRYKLFVSRFTKHPLADNASYNQAALLAGPLRDPAAALQILDAAIAAYPNGDMLSESIMLRERLLPGPSDMAVLPKLPSASPAAQAQQVEATSSSALAKQKHLYATAAAQWRTLLMDDKKGGLRQSWLNLEQTFASALRAAPGGPEAHKASFQMARCREELARRSTNPQDWQEAVGYFAAMAEAYPKSSLADDSLYSQAEILAQRLKSPAEASALLHTLLDKYPGTDAAPKARKLLAQLSATQSTRQTDSGGRPKASPSGAAASPAPVPPDPQKISGSSGQRNTKAKAGAAVLEYLEWQGDADRLLLTVQLHGRAKYRRAVLAADPARNLPQRLRLDLLGTSLAEALERNIVLSGTPATAIKSSLESGGNARLELYLDAARSYKITVLQNPYRLQIELHGTRLLAGGEDLGKVRPAAEPTRSASLVEQLGLDIKTIMIDAGHGGKDPGAIGNGLRESAVTLDLAKRLGAELKKKGFTVLSTRESNRFVELADRTGLANGRKADIFVSIHVNASTNKSLHGLETYYLDAARSDAARVVAAKENSVDVGRTSDLQFILSDLTRNSKKEESLALSRQVQKACITRLKNLGFKIQDNGVRSAPFYVLMGARMPAFLIEIGYLSHASDVSRIKNPQYLQAIANGIADGITAYQRQLNRLAR